VPASAAQATTTLEQLIEEECARFVQSLTSRIQSMDELDFAFLVRRIKQVEKEVSKAIIERGLAETHGNRQLLSKKLNITKRTIRYILNEKG
jgi:two-component system NtrC family response regulator